MCSSATLFAVIVSAITALSAPISNAGSFSVPARYAWSFENWSGGWYGIGWANFQISAPEATSGDVVIPELSLTGICHIVGHGGETSNCNDLIEDNTDGRSLLFTLRPFDASIQEVQLDATYRFKSGGSNSTYEISGAISRRPNGLTEFDVAPKTLKRVS